MDDLVEKAEAGELAPEELEELREKVLGVEAQGTAAVTANIEEILGRAHSVLNKGTAAF